MKVALDTNVIVAIQKRNAAVPARLAGFSAGEVVLPAMVLHELWFGAYNSTQVGANVAEIERLRFPVLDFDAEDGRVAAMIRADLRRRGTPIGPYETLIAGQALARDLTLVTRNGREFARIEGLRVEDWEG